MAKSCFVSAPRILLDSYAPTKGNVRVERLLKILQREGAYVNPLQHGC